MPLSTGNTDREPLDSRCLEQLQQTFKQDKQARGGKPQPPVGRPTCRFLPEPCCTACIPATIPGRLRIFPCCRGLVSSALMLIFIPVGLPSLTETKPASFPATSPDQFVIGPQPSIHTCSTWHRDTRRRRFRGRYVWALNSKTGHRCERRRRNKCGWGHEQRCSRCPGRTKAQSPLRSLPHNNPTLRSPKSCYL